MYMDTTTSKWIYNLPECHLNGIVYSDERLHASSTELAFLLSLDSCVGNKSQSVIEDIVWNLRTWPLELVEWTTNNSHRLDICLDPEQDRSVCKCVQRLDEILTLFCVFVCSDLSCI